MISAIPSPTKNAIPRWANGETILVLVVDDDPILADQLTQGLEARDIHSQFVTNATDALARLAAEPGIGVLMTDLRMPDGGGQALAEALLALRAESAAVEVVIITGRASPEDTALARLAGVTEILCKPFRLAEASCAVTRSMARAAERRRAALGGPGPAGVPPEAPRDTGRQCGALLPAMPAASLTRPRSALAASRPSVEAVQDLQGEAPTLVPTLVPTLATALAPPSRLHLPAALAVALGRLGPVAQARGITLDLEAPMPELMVEGDGAGLRQALAHALGALLEACETGSAVRASLALQMAASGAWAVITLLATPAGGREVPPPELAFEAVPEPCKPEPAHLALARQMIAPQGGQLSAWHGPGGCMAIRLALRS